MDKRQWEPRRHGLLYIVERLVFADFAGSGYKWARNSYGFVRRVLTRRSAQKVADELNATAKGN